MVGNLPEILSAWQYLTKIFMYKFHKHYKVQTLIICQLSCSPM